MKKIIFFLTIVSIPVIANIETQTHKIIYLISAPRSLSTAFLRMMDARGDFTVINEPSWYAFDLTIFKPEEVSHLFKQGHPATFAQVKEKIYAAAKKTNVFVKEISFAVAAFLLEDDELIKDPDVHFIFLLRDPHASLLSFYKKQVIDIPLEKFGYRGCWFIFEKVKNEGANPPILILAEDLSADPHKTVSMFCQKVGIPFIPESLHWKDLGDNFNGEKQWHDGKVPHELYHWHSDAIHSTGFGALSQYKVDAEGRPTFEEVINEKDRHILLAGYDFNRGFYNLLLQQKKYICHNYLITTDEIKSVAKKWVKHYLISLPLEDSWLIANYLFLQYATLAEQIFLHQKSSALKELTHQIDQYLSKNDAQIFSYPAKLDTLFNEFKNTMQQYEVYYSMLEACTRSLEQSNIQLCQAMHRLQIAGSQLLTQLVAQENEACPQAALALNKAVIHLFYNEAYVALTQEKHLHIPLMVSTHGLIPPSERFDYLPSLEI